MPDTTPPPRRIELTLSKPPIGWYPKPTVVFGGHGHPAQWGTGTWQAAEHGPTEVKVFLFNRMWRFGAAEAVVAEGETVSLVYRAPWLPFLNGSIKRA
ncbi:hypothetical protein ACFVWR_13720 [Leifsonia sp. NPDC058292]|uniref:hypothetical protein n=1 Tax=Leifsonia sp. NPDC058292 TaxID=3346428 RepID=UPI0036DC4557